MENLEKELYYLELELKMIEERWNAYKYLSRDEQKELGVMSYFQDRDTLHMKIELLKIKVELSKREAA